MDNLLSILELNYYSIYIKANADMHYTTTRINMNTPTNANNHLHIGINMYISQYQYLYILAYIRVYKYTYRYNKKQKIMNTLKHPCANIFVFFKCQYTNVLIYHYITV